MGIKISSWNPACEMWKEGFLLDFLGIFSEGYVCRLELMQVMKCVIFGYLRWALLVVSKGSYLPA